MKYMDHAFMEHAYTVKVSVYGILYFKMHRIKCNGDGGSCAPWWLASAYSGNTNNACNVDNNGSPDCYHVNSPYFCVPVCFRISA